MAQTIEEAQKYLKGGQNSKSKSKKKRHSEQTVRETRSMSKAKTGSKKVKRS